ncbi:MAG: hypothetical protein LIP06_06130, partial [Tannerellaceae bacterium]|nr:hypothetical protein [Tannerellaceae bacterium]
NYNDFETCYNVLGDLIKKYERKLSDDTTSNTLIHISPGTALISSCMSLYAIKGNRTLLYTTQDVKVTRSFDYDIFTTEELLNELWKEYDN